MRIEAQQSLILTIDMQDRLLGAIPETERNQAIQNVTRLLAAAAALEIPRLATVQYAKGLGPIRADLQSFCAPHWIKRCFPAGGMLRSETYWKLSRVVVRLS